MWTGGAGPTHACDAEIAACTGGTCSINNDQALDQKIYTLQLDGTTNITGNTLLLGGGLYLPNPINATVAPEISAARGALTFYVGSANASLTIGDVRLFETYNAYDGAGLKTVNGVVRGTGTIGVFNGTVTLNATPTFAGQFEVFGGTLIANLPLAEKTFLSGSGVLRGVGPFFAIEQNGGIFYPGTGTAPITVDVGDLTLLSKTILNFSAGNASHSVINSSGSVLLAGMTLQLNFDTAPPINTTFTGLINSPGGHISGCPARVLAVQPNLILAPICTNLGLGATLTGNDRVKFAGFEQP